MYTRHPALLLLLLVLCFTAGGQNLFPNPGFENHILCPDKLYQVNRCDDWGGRHKGSPDYFNCSFYGQGITGNVPFAVPASGTGVMGFASQTRQLKLWVYTEGITAGLLQALKAGHNYQLTFSLRISSQGILQLLLRPGEELGFGFYFYNKKKPPEWSDTITYCNSFTPQISIPASAVDTYDRYKSFTFCYTPEEDYDSVYIGVVCTPESTILPLNTYYFNLDDLSLAEIHDEPLSVTVSETKLCIDSCLRISVADTAGIQKLSWLAPGATGPPIATLPLYLCYKQDGSYPVQLSVRRKGCVTQVWRDTVQVTGLLLSALHDTILCPGEAMRADLNYLHGSEVRWEDGDTSHTRLFAQTGSHVVTVHSGGCVRRKMFTVTMREYCTDAVMVPDAFSPNGDGRNDVFHVLSNYPLKNFTIRIYNRWGQCVFYHTDYRQGWDGKGMDIGTFFYRIEYEHPLSHELITMKGDVTLVR